MALTMREAERDFECVLRDVPITGTNHSLWYAQFLRDNPGEDLEDIKFKLVRDKTNGHDPNAVKVMVSHVRERTLQQVGWIGMQTGHSAKVAKLLDACPIEGGYILVTHHEPRSRMHMSCLRGDVYLPVVPKAVAPPKLSGPIVRRIYENNTRTEQRVNLMPYAGKLLVINTGSQRVSVTLRTGDGTQVGWFRKADFAKDHPAHFDLDKASQVGYLALVITGGSVMLISPKQAGEHGYKMAGGVPIEASRFKLEDHFLEPGHRVSAGRVVTDEFGTKSVEYPYGMLTDECAVRISQHPDSSQARFERNLHLNDHVKAFTTPPPGYTATSVVHDEIILTPTQPPKETTMSKIAQTATAIINTNKSAAATAGYMEAGRLANNQAAKLAGKHLPFMLKAYADTPIGKLVIANVAQAAVKQLRPNDATLNELTEAMIVQAFQELYQLVDLDGILDSLTSSPEMTRALDKVKSSRTEA